MKKLVILMGPSGSGKSTVEQHLVNRYDFGKITSHTTRPPREGEEDGKDYHFVESMEGDDFAEMEKVGDFLYGISKDEIDIEKDSVLVIEPNGAKTVLSYIKDKNIEPVVVFLDPPEQLCRSRMLYRGDDPEKVEHRISGLDTKIRIDFDHLVESNVLDGIHWAKIQDLESGEFILKTESETILCTERARNTIAFDIDAVYILSAISSRFGVMWDTTADISDLVLAFTQKIVDSEKMLTDNLPDALPEWERIGEIYDIWIDREEIDLAYNHVTEPKTENAYLYELLGKIACEIESRYEDVGAFYNLDGKASELYVRIDGEVTTITSYAQLQETLSQAKAEKEY